MAKFEIPTIDLPVEATRPLYAGVGATDLVVGYVREAVADLQKRVTAIELEPKALRDQAVGVVVAQIDALSKDAKSRRESIEKRVVELQADAAGIPATVTAVYADLAKRGEVLVGRINRQQSTKDAKASASTTAAKAKTTKTQATKAAKKTTTTAKKTAKKTSSTPKSSAKATATAAKATASKTAAAVGDAAAKVGD
jgi:hypothetical protein